MHQIRRALPRVLSQQLSTPSLQAAATRALTHGCTRRDLDAALTRSWDGAGPGAVITFIRTLTPIPTTPPATRTCPDHPHITLTRGEQCTPCRKERESRSLSPHMRRQQGESTHEWITRIATESTIT